MGLIVSNTVAKLPLSGLESITDEKFFFVSFVVVLLLWLQFFVTTVTPLPTTKHATAA